MSEIRGLTLWEPFASLIASRIKTIETRSWGTAYRGLVAIHAAKRWSGDQEDDWEDIAELLPEYDLTPDQLQALQALRPRENLGCILCVAQLVDCRPMPVTPKGPNALCGTFGPGRWGWILGDITPLPEPIPCSGARQLWQLSAAVQARLVAQLPPLERLAPSPQAKE